MRMMMMTATRKFAYKRVARVTVHLCRLKIHGPLAVGLAAAGNVFLDLPGWVTTRREKF